MTQEEMKRARAWIEKKERSGVSRSTLRHTVGCFSNKKREKVMREKSLSSAEYERRYRFLGNVYELLCSGKK